MTAGRRGRPTNGLMLAFAFVLPYHVLRTASEAGVRVHVLGNGASRNLWVSRYCASYRELPCPGEPEHAEPILAEIRRVVERHGIDVIFPSDDVSTRLLAGLRDRLPVRCSPLPDLAGFDRLNDKGNFTRFCLENGVRVPQGWVFDSAAGLCGALERGEVRLPLTVKPTNRSGGVGVLHIRSKAELSLLDRIDYQPVLAQRHIVGETVGISVVCRDGQVLAHAAQRRDERRFQLFAHADLLANTERLIVATRLNGPANFDAVIEDCSGDSYIVECNPRFWYTIFMSMVCGLNFMAPALAEPGTGMGVPATRANVDIQLQLGRTLRHPWQASRTDWRLLRYHLADPIPYLLNRGRWIDDSAVAVRPEQMDAYDWRREAAPPTPAVSA